MKITAVTCVKNEGPFLLEWVAFHRVLGVTDFLIYSNDCDDGTDALLDALMEAGVVEHLPNPATSRNYQMEALRHAKQHPRVMSADWVWIADVDEFLNIHVGNNTVPALIDACGNPSAISVSYQFFANNGVTPFEDRPVIAQFDKTHNPDLWCAERAIEVKTLVQSDFPLHYYGAHRPFLKTPAQHDASLVWTDGSGRAVPRAFVACETERRIRRFPAAGARRFATLNHYALRSVDSFLVKIERGDVNRANRAFDLAYWEDRNDPAWTDHSIQSYMPALTKSIAELKTIPRIASAHRACVSAHQKKIKRLLDCPDTRKLRARLLQTWRLPEREAALLERINLAPWTSSPSLAPAADA